ncbi:MAG TPA: hypothetical protein VLH38_02705 [Patescibacteria group bacterium]|nr:hypothetical protein [Patescibacteria group bacterium]
MMSSLRSELRKILTVRSTYVILGITFIILLFFAFYAEGLHASVKSVADPGLLAQGAQQAIITVGLLGALVGVLLVTHEYRYNTIMYTLTASNSRTKTLLAKLIVVSGFSIVFSLTVGALAPAMTLAGLHVKGITLVGQHFPIMSILWQTLFVGWGYSMLAFVLASIVRIQVGAVSTLFLVPAMLEPILGFVLKEDSIYLPFNALQSVAKDNPEFLHVSNLRAVVIVLVYFVVGLLVSWQLFLRRDAN